MTTIDVYYDFSSPFAYLGYLAVKPLAARYNATLVDKPFLLGGLFKEIGTPLVPLAHMPAVKQTHMMLDLCRWADHWGIPFRYTSHFPVKTVTALRVVLSVEMAQRRMLSERFFRATWVEDRNVSETEVVLEVCQEAGLDGPALIESAQSPDGKARLALATEQAKQRGVCGAPVFDVEGMLFWGQDRLDMVDKVLQGWRPSYEANEAQDASETREAM